METKKENRQYEYIRAFSIIAVIIIHTMYMGILQFGDTTSSVNILNYRVIMNLMWWAVPCFFMLSGSLLLNVNKEISLKKIYGKYVFRMLLVLFTFGTVFSWMEIFFDTRTLSVMQILQAFMNVLMGKTWAHMWYIYCLLGIYVLLPVYKLISKYATDKQLEYVLLILFIFESILPFIKSLGIDLGFYCHINTIYPFWVLMGVVWNRGLFTRTSKFNIIVVIVSSGLLIVFSFLWIIGKYEISGLFGYDSILVVIQSIALFGLFNKIKLKGCLEHLFMQIADKSFGIYLVHMVFINVVYKLIKFNPFNTLFSWIGLVVVNLILSYFIVVVLRFIPGVKKFI